MDRIYRVIVMVAALAAAAHAQTTSTKARDIEAFVDSFAKANQFSGEIVASENGKVIFDRAFGLANADFKIPNTPNTRIGIASINKSMTVVVLTRLIEERKLTLDDKVAKFIPDFPNGDKITVAMLAQHRSGIPHRVMDDAFESMPYTSAQMIENIKKAKLAFEPGTQRMYSSAGYSVLARILEIVSGKPYATLLQDYVFGPAGMADSLDFNGETIIERHAQDYLLTEAGYINAALKDYSFLIGAGSVVSTAGDLHRFGMAVIDGKYGASVKASLVRDGVISSNGNTNGHRAYFEIKEDKSFGYAIASNLGAGSFDYVQAGIKDILQGKAPANPRPVIPKTDQKAIKDLREYVGHYKRADGSETDLTIKEGFLYSADIKMYPVKPDCFFDYKYFGDACFTRTEAGAIKELRWKGLGFELVWAKQ